MPVGNVSVPAPVRLARVVPPNEAVRLFGVEPSSPSKNETMYCCLIDLSPKGTPITPQVVQNPAITAPDGANTSFFEIPPPLDTSNPPFPGEPASSTNLTPANQLSLEYFFGTSSAAPNAAAVAALMLQAKPSLSRVQILKALTTTVLPMNGTPSGTWNAQSGYGLVNAVAAIKSIAPPPGAATSITVSPSVISPVFGLSVTLTATVAGSSGTRPAAWIFTTRRPTPNWARKSSRGQASLTITPPVGGSHVYLETYSGDSEYARNTTYLLLIVTGDSTTTTVVTSPNPGNFDQLAAVSISVAGNGPGSATPTGTVAAFDDTYGLNLGTAGLVNGSVTFQTLYPIGSDTITYTYSGDGNFLPSNTTQTQQTLDSVLVLDPFAPGALSLSRNASLAMPGGVVVDSNSPAALYASDTPRSRPPRSMSSAVSTRAAPPL